MGLPKVATTEFTTESPDGTIDVEVKFDATELAGHSLVFFEKLTDESESIIAVHEDIDDEGQTITFPEPIPEPENPGKGYPKTGGFADIDPVAASLLVIAICGISGAAYAYIRRARKQTGEVEELEKSTMESKED